MELKEMQEALRAGVKPSPDYPNLPNDFTAEELIAFDPKAELQYRMVKDQRPDFTRAMLMQSWRSFRIGRLFGGGDDGSSGESRGLAAFFRRAAALFKRQR